MKCILPLLLCLFATPALAAAPKPLLLAHAGLIDGTGLPVQRDMTIVIEGKRIVAVYPDGSQPVPKDAEVRDLSRKYVIPGLIDAHVHITDAEPDIAHCKTVCQTSTWVPGSPAMMPQAPRNDDNFC
ncbi:MAG TPA: hypothetical protein VJL61_03590 [Rhodanobacteraceae bacterium]|nr:hypothetical protein [Rhodanobacteraceae bacterium]